MPTLIRPWSPSKSHQLPCADVVASSGVLAPLRIDQNFASGSRDRQYHVVKIVERFKSIVIIIKNGAYISALIFAGYWGYTTFVYPEQYRPEDYQAHLSVEQRVESIRILSDRAIIAINIRIFNHSKRFLRNLAAYYQVFGQIDECGRSELDWQAIINELNEQRHTVAHWDVFPRQRSEVVSVGRLVPDNWWFAPGEEYNYQFVFSAPRDVAAVEILISLDYFHHSEDIFRGTWKKMSENKNLLFDIEVKKDGNYEALVTASGDDNETAQEHKRLAAEHGLRFSTAMSEVDIPWQHGQDRCN